MTLEMGRVDKYMSQARERAKRRKSPWNLLLIPLAIAGVDGLAGEFCWRYINGRDHAQYLC